MEAKDQARTQFEPEIYCLRCQMLEWDEEARRCANFDSEICPLDIRRVLAGLQVECLVI